MKFINASIATLFAVVVAFALPGKTAQAEVLTGQLNVHTVCHDGANRGATIRLWINRYKSQPVPGGSAINFGAKTYYTRITCKELGVPTRPHMWPNQWGDILYAWTDHGIGTRWAKLCKDFTIRYVPEPYGKKIIIQTGGTTVGNITCVAKDEL